MKRKCMNLRQKIRFVADLKNIQIKRSEKRKHLLSVVCAQLIDLNFWQGFDKPGGLRTMALYCSDFPHWHQIRCKVSPPKCSSSPPLHCSFNFLLFALLTFYIFWHREQNKLHFLDHFCFNQPTVRKKINKNKERASAPQQQRRKTKFL